MNIKRFNISKPKKYTTSKGEEKTKWDIIGSYVEITRDDGTMTRIIEIPAINLEARVFEIRSRDNYKPNF